MKIVFLDIDGVFNYWSWWINDARKGLRHPQNAFDPACVERFNRLIEQSKAQVVLSSSWRTDRSADASKLLARVGINCTLAGVTPRLERPVMRGDEIRAWMVYMGQPIESFVILDDDDDMGELLPRLVQTNPSVGLQDSDVDRALAMLEVPA